MKKQTPAMQQYFEIKEKYPDAFLFFQMGDFFELFGEDAVRASKLIDITLTSRDKASENPLPMAGVPLKAKDKYLARLIELGHKVVICEQIGEAIAGKVVERKVTEVLSSGLIVDENLIDESVEQKAFAIVNFEEVFYGAGIDLSVGKIEIFKAGLVQELLSYIGHLDPKMIILQKGVYFPEFLEKGFSDGLFFLEKKYIGKDFDLSNHPIHKYYKARSSGEKLAMDLLFTHIYECHFDIPKNIISIEEIEKPDFKMNNKSFEHLEIFENLQNRTSENSLYNILSKTSTSQGTRYMKKLMKSPTSNVSELNKRYDSIEKYIADKSLRNKIEDKLKYASDLDRVSSRIAKNKTRPSDLKAILNTLKIRLELENEIAHNSN